MKTTSLLVEILVIGAIALIWAAPLAGTWTPGLMSLGQIPDLASAVLWIAQMYVLGMGVSFVADRLAKWPSRSIYEGEPGRRRAQRRRATALTLSSEVADYIHRRRSFIRLHRANALNFVLIAVALVASPESFSLDGGRVIPVLGSLGVAVLFGWGYCVALRGYCAFLEDVTA